LAISLWAGTDLEVELEDFVTRADEYDLGVDERVEREMKMQTYLTRDVEHNISDYDKDLTIIDT
jgi:hypothetical protein